MIKIIKDGQKEFIGNCVTCGCQFSYEINDIALNGVRCPCCYHIVAHKDVMNNTLDDGECSAELRDLWTKWLDTTL